MNPEILVKLKELELLIEKERKPEEDRTIVDFFRPVAHKMIEIMRWKAIKNVDYQGYVNTSPIENRGEIIKAIEIAFNQITPESLLEHGGSLYDDSDWMKEVIELIKDRHMSQAVKIYKNNTGLGLRECKDYIDRLNEQIISGKL